MRTDAFGNEYGVGDIIVYATRSGSSLTMTKAEVVGFTEDNSPKVQRLESTSNMGMDKYTDTRTGKEVRWRYSTPECIAREAYWKHRYSDEEISKDQFWTLSYPRRQEYDLVPTKFHDWLKHEHIVPVLVLPVAQSVVLVEKRSGG